MIAYLVISVLIFTGFTYLQYRDQALQTEAYGLSAPVITILVALAWPFVLILLLALFIASET